MNKENILWNSLDGWERELIIKEMSITATTTLCFVKSREYKTIFESTEILTTSRKWRACKDVNSYKFHVTGEGNRCDTIITNIERIGELYNKQIKSRGVFVTLEKPVSK